jgi:putative CocE/NonD family hydrolase
MQVGDTPDVRVDFDVEIPMRDGTLLRGDIYRPAGGAPVPALLTRTPYDKRVVTHCSMGVSLRMALARGYAIISQDVRGRFRSDGDFLMVPTQAVEGPDGYDTIEWIARQPWCSGAVGMFGLSYQSLTQLMAAIERPPSLKAIIPEKTGSPARGAIMLDSAMIVWAAQQAGDWLQKAIARGEAGPEDAAIIQQVMRDPPAAARLLPLNEMPLMKIGALPGFQEMIDLLHSQADLNVGAIACPALVVGGWYDVAPTETAQIYATLERRAGVETDAVFGPWDHVNNGSGLGEAYFSPFAGSETSRMPTLFLDFFDRHLKGDETKPAPGVRYFVMGANEWRLAASWPPDYRPRALYLHSDGEANGVAGDGRLVAEPQPPGMKADRYRYDPRDPVPSIGGRYLEGGGSRPGPFDQRRVEARKDVLVYTTPVLEQDIDIAGSIALRLFVRCSTPDTDFVAKLCDVSPEGSSLNIVDEFFRCRWREGYDKTALLEPGRTYEFEIDLGPTAHRFRAGHRLRLQVTSSAFPHFDRNMNTGHAIGVDSIGEIATITVLHDAEHPAQLILPVVAGDGYWDNAKQSAKG